MSKLGKMITSSDELVSVISHGEFRNLVYSLDMGKESKWNS